MATPEESVAVRLVPCKAAVPTVPRATVTVDELSVVMTLPNWSSSLTTGWVVKSTPAVVEEDGSCVTTSLLGAAGLTTILPLVPVARFPLENLSVMVSAVSSARLVKVAIPPETVAVSVPVSGPEPLARETVTTVLLSPVSRLPFWSSS